MNIDELYRKAVSGANNIALAGFLGFGFFFVALVASDKLPDAVRSPMQIIMMVASALYAVMVVVGPFLNKTKDENRKITNPPLTSPQDKIPGYPRDDWRDMEELVKRYEEKRK